MDFDIIVIGGGHAGLEAALAGARLGYSTQLITQNLDCIAKMSCNPAVGGLSKGNIVREIDALGGEMGRLIDQSMIQFRILNRSRGPAVQAPRAQADKARYSRLAKQVLEGQEHLCLFQDTVTGFILDSGGRSVCGVVTERGRRFRSSRVILTTGTFMEAEVFIGEFRTSSGRLGEPAACGLGPELRRLGFTVGRLKTGTPARVARSSIDFGLLERQDGDETMQPFSFSGEVPPRPNIPCHITFTNPRTHRIITENLGRSPLYTGKISGTGPRYCPSIEDKVVRFPDRDRHQIFVEPEGPDTEEMYLNGISSSLPEEVQEAFLRTLDGFADVQVMRPGYAVEYDYLDPTQLYPSLETKRLKGLYVAGQTNGTSGYEEAAGQGLLAGINAALSMEGREALVLSRAEAYVGVLVDDLVTLGTKEPYRMFTSRAEYRLCLRHDTADRRLLRKGYEAGLRGRESLERLEEKIAGIEAIKELLRQRRLLAEDLQRQGSSTEAFLGKHRGKELYQILKDPEVQLSSLESLLPEAAGMPEEWRRQAELDVKYEGYIARQERQVHRFMKMEQLRIPSDLDYDRIEGISNESREKLKKIRPLSVGQASRISGVRNSDIAVLLILLGRG
jgi:tRNA uridine 5-carboxymethylaminomethyl modification enzyme